MTPVTDPSTRAAVRSAALERFTRLLAGANSTTRTLATWCGEPPTTHIHTREEAATLPAEAVLLGLPPTTTLQRRQVTHRRRDGTVLCQARAVVRLDSPALPGPVVAGAPSVPAGCGTTAGRSPTTTRTERCWRCRPRWRSPTSGWPWFEETYLEPVLW